MAVFYPVLRDRIAQRVLGQAREAEMEQAIDRVRPLTRFATYLLCDIPVDLTIDEALRWADPANTRHRPAADERLAKVFKNARVFAFSAVSPSAPRG